MSFEVVLSHGRPMRHPLLPVASAYALGVVLGDFLELPLPWLFALAYLVLGFCLLPGRRSRGWLLGLCLLAGWTNMITRTAVLSPMDLRCLVGEEPVLARLRGELLREPRLRVSSRGDREFQRTTAVLKLRAVELEDQWKPASGRVWLTVPTALPDGYHAGGLVDVYGVLRRPDLLVRQVVIPQLHLEMWENVADATRFGLRVLDRL